MKFNNRQNKIVKDDDGKVHWISRSLAVVVVIILNGEKVLLVKRGRRVKQSGKWCNPCGYLDWDETAEECAVREIFEETGLDITKCKIVKNFMDKPYEIITHPGNNNKQDVAIHFGALIESDIEPFITTKYAEPGESDDVKWVDLKDLNNYRFAFNHNERIEKFLNLIK